jgi:hypothetical protein
LLNALKQIDFNQFEGIVEGNEIYFLYSEKGKHGGKSKHRGISREQVYVLVARDR